MDPNLLNFLLSFGSGVAATATTDSLKAIYQKLFEKRPDLQQRLLEAGGGPGTAEAMAEIAGEIEAMAGYGAINIDGAIITAMRNATFDHQNGTVTIGKTKISAKILSIGSKSGSGRTDISGETTLKGGGSTVEVTKGAAIMLTGSATIKIS